jgi:hypothetical protein
MKGLWLLPTRRRVPIVKRFLKAAVTHGMREPGRILVGDKELEELKHEYASIDLPDNWTIVASPHDSICETMRGALPLYKSLDWAGTITDDVVPETPGWEQKLLEWNDGRTIISCDDGGQAPKRMAGAIIWPIPIFRAVGYWVPSGFRHCFVDDLWESLGRECDCWRVRMDVMVRHIHPFGAGGVEDDTHRHSYRADKWANDSALYEQWKASYKAIALAKLRAFLGASQKEAA